MSETTTTEAIRGLRMVGTAEAADMLGMTRPRVAQLRHGDVGFPEPLADLKSGPVWDADAIEAWFEAWETTPGVKRPKALTPFYVEVYVERPDPTGRNDRFFRMSLQEGRGNKEAERVAIGEATAAYPDATNIEFFLSRKVTPDKANRIQDALEAGTWQGWFNKGPGFRTRSSVVGAEDSD